MFPCPPLYHKPYYHHSHFDSSYLLHHVFTKQGLTCNVGDSFGVSSNLALSLSKKRILILNKNNTSLKFGSSSTSEIFPWGEKKTTTRFFFLCCSEKLREWLLFSLLINPKWLQEFCSNFLKNHFGNKSKYAF